MTTDDRQLRLISLQAQENEAERRVLRLLMSISTWAATPRGGIDWGLEEALDDLRVASHELEQIRGDMDLPF